MKIWKFFTILFSYSPWVFWEPYCGRNFEVEKTLRQWNEFCIN